MVDVMVWPSPPAWLARTTTLCPALQSVRGLHLASINSLTQPSMSVRSAAQFDD